MASRKAHPSATRSNNAVVRALGFLISKLCGGFSSGVRPELIEVRNGLSSKGEELGKCLLLPKDAFSDCNSGCADEWEKIAQELTKLRQRTRKVATTARTRIEDFRDVFAPFIIKGKTRRDIRLAEIEPFSKDLESLEGDAAAVLAGWNALHNRIGRFKQDWAPQLSDNIIFKGVENRVTKLMLINQRDGEMVVILKNTAFPGLMTSLSILLPKEISKRFHNDILSTSGHQSGTVDTLDESSKAAGDLDQPPCLDGLINVCRMIKTDLKSVDSASQRVTSHNLQGLEWQTNIQITLEVYSYFALSLEKFLANS